MVNIFVSSKIKNSKASKDKKNRVTADGFFTRIKYHKFNIQNQCCEISQGIYFKRTKTIINNK